MFLRETKRRLGPILVGSDRLSDKAHPALELGLFLGADDNEITLRIIIVVAFLVDIMRCCGTY